MIEIKDETFNGSYPFEPNVLELGNFKMHYVDEGEGEPVVMLHGDPTWGYLWRKFIPSVSETKRVIVPDHMGMGKSSVPKEPYPYLLKHHISNLEQLILNLKLSGITLVLHDWGGPVGMGFAIRHPELIKRIVIMNTWAFAQWPGGELPRLLEIIRSEKGESFVLEKNGYVKRALLGTANYPDNYSSDVLETYLAPFPTPESRLALLCWSRDITYDERDKSYPDMEEIEKNLTLFSEIPVLIIWGMLDPVLPVTVLEKWLSIYPHAKVCKIEDASHFLQDDTPEKVITELNKFLSSK
ncbi:MAG: alpha/beta fold hydrolase [Thermodesulfobacteriota bacterium]